MEMNQESRCVQDAASRSTPADPNVKHLVPRRRLRTMGGVQIGDAGGGEFFHRGCFTGGDYRLDQERPDLG